MNIPFNGVPLREHRAIVEELAELGYNDVWSGEGSAHDAFTPLALAAAWSPTLRVATGIVPAFTRGPAVLAQTVAGMCEAAPGRFVLGLGCSSKVIVEEWNGTLYDRPVQRIRDLVRFLRSALTGRKVTQRYDTFRVSGFQLGVEAPDPLPPILIAGLRPRMLELAGAESDGAIVNWLSADDLDLVTSLIPAGKELVARVKVVASNDWSEIRTIATRLINAYFHVAAYRRSQEWLGRGSSLRPMWDAWASGDRRQATDAIPDEVIDQLFVWGDLDMIRAGVRRFAAKGATTVVPVVYGSTGDAREVIRNLAPASEGARGTPTKRESGS